MKQTHRRDPHLDDFKHVPKEWRKKVATDFLSHLVLGTRQWDHKRFNPLNDYQRHLYALFLRLAGFNEAQVFAQVYHLSTDVERQRRERYVNEVIHSAIVGFPKEDGSLIAIPSQQVVLAGG